MSNDLEAVWKKVDEHGRAISGLETRDAVLEAQLNQLTSAMEDLKGQVMNWLIEQRLRTETTDKKIDALKSSVDSGRGAMSMARWGVGFFVSFITIAVSIAAILVSVS